MRNSWNPQTLLNNVSCRWFPDEKFKFSPPEIFQFRPWKSTEISGEWGKGECKKREKFMEEKEKKIEGNEKEMEILEGPG